MALRVLTAQRTLQGAPAGGMIDPNAAAGPALAAADAAERVGQSIRRVGNVFEQVAVQQKKTRQAGELADLSSKAQRRLADLQAQYDQDPDYETRAQRFQLAARDAREELAGATKDRDVATIFRRDFDEVSLQKEIAVREGARKFGQSWAVAKLDDAQATFAQAAAGANSPEERQSILKQYSLQVAGAINAGVLDPADGFKRIRAIQSDVDEASVRTVLTNDPGRAMQALDDPSMFPGLSPERRATLFDQASRRYDAKMELGVRLSEKAERLADKRVAEQEKEAADSLFAANADGTLTRADLEANRPNLNSQDYRTLLAALKRAPGDIEDDPETIQKLTAMVGSTPEEDFSAEAGKAMRAGQLKTDTFRVLVGQNRQFNGENKPPPVYQRALDRVKRALNPDDIPFSQFMMGPLREAQSNAIEELNKWVTDNPKASPTDMLATADTIVSRYKQGGQEEARMTMAKPYGFGGAREQITPEVVAKSKADLLAQAASLPESTLLREVQLLQAWEGLANSSATGAAPAKTGGRGVNQGTGE